MNQQNVNSDSKHLIISLIKEELKSCKFFNGLAAIDLDHSFYRPDLSNLILGCLGLNDDQDKTFDLYYALMQKHSRKLTTNPNSIEHHARLVYRALAKVPSATQGNTKGMIRRS